MKMGKIGITKSYEQKRPGNLTKEVFFNTPAHMYLDLGLNGD